MGYDPKSNSKQETFLMSASYLEPPKSPISSMNLGNSSHRVGKSSSLISHQPLQQYCYQKKFMLKDIADYVLINSTMIALITLPQVDERAKGAYPRLLVLLLPDVKSNLKNSQTNTKFHLYEIPSSLHIIDVKKTKFLVSNGTLI